MKVLRQRLGGAVQFEGVGGRAMAREGLDSLFPIEELSIIGLAAVVDATAEDPAADPANHRAVTEAAPDILVIIDSPDFTHRVAQTRAGARRQDPDRRLRLALGLGVAAGPGAGDADLCRPCAGAAAVRARGLSEASAGRRAAMSAIP